MNWRRWWGAWIVAGILAELVSLRRGTPLTQVMRPTVLVRRAGSALLGGFFAWIMWHWLFDASGLDWIDAVMAAAGAVVGVLGHWWRERRHERS